MCPGRCEAWSIKRYNTRSTLLAVTIAGGPDGHAVFLLAVTIAGGLDGHAVFHLPRPGDKETKALAVMLSKTCCIRYVTSQ